MRAGPLGDVGAGRPHKVPRLRGLSIIAAMTAPPIFTDRTALLDRLGHAFLAGERPIVFLVGSGLTMPGRTPEERGVPGVDGVIDLIRDALGDGGQDARRALELALQKEVENRYQAAFRCLFEWREPATVSAIVRRAVLTARLPRSYAGAPG